MYDIHNYGCDDNLSQYNIFMKVNYFYVCFIVKQLLRIVLVTICLQSKSDALYSLSCHRIHTPAFFNFPFIQLLSIQL